jgi:hypothetical protein
MEMEGADIRYNAQANFSRGKSVGLGSIHQQQAGVAGGRTLLIILLIAHLMLVVAAAHINTVNAWLELRIYFQLQLGELPVAVVNLRGQRLLFAPCFCTWCAAI